jgi:hypothetical protein
MGPDLKLSQTWTSVAGPASASLALRPDQLIKVQKGKDAEALKAMRLNGADDLAFSYKGDLYIASGREMKEIAKLNLHDRKHAINGEPVTIVKKDDEINRPVEGGRQTFSAMIGPGSIEVPFAAIGAVVGSLYGAVKSILPNKEKALAAFGEPVTDGPFAE